MRLVKIIQAQPVEIDRTRGDDYGHHIEPSPGFRNDFGVSLRCIIETKIAHVTMKSGSQPGMLGGVVCWGRLARPVAREG